MNNSLKAGIISGLIAGIIQGILIYYIDIFAASIGLYESYWRQIYFEGGHLWIDVAVASIFGIILGMIYSKVYSLVPGKKNVKGLSYAIILFFVYNIRTLSYWLAYGWVLTSVAHSLQIISTLSFGILLGTLYEFLHNKYKIPKEKKKIIQYDWKSGIHPGAIAGLCGGMTASIVAIFGPAIGLWKVSGYPETITFDLWMGQAGSHILINMIWGTIFGVFFTKVFTLVPSRGVLKGIIFGLIVFLLTTFQFQCYGILIYLYHNELDLAKQSLGFGWSVGFAQAIVYGLVLGLLYRKPPK
jgi:hypothetical protein